MKTRQPVPPPAVRTATLSLLAPFYPGLDDAGLLAALRRQSQPSVPPAEPPHGPQGLRPADAAKVFGVSVRSLRNYSRRGLLHPVKLSRRCVVFDSRELARVLAGDLSPTTPAAPATSEAQP